MVEIQHIYGEDQRTNEVLLRLRHNFRACCGLPLPTENESFSDLEMNAIFVLCYGAHNGLATPVEVRAQRWTKDIEEYRAGQRGLPYYVMRTDHRIRTEGIIEIILSPAWWEHYTLIYQHKDQPVAHYPRPHVIAPSP